MVKLDRAQSTDRPSARATRIVYSLGQPTVPTLLDTSFLGRLFRLQVGLLNAILPHHLNK